MLPAVIVILLMVALVATDPDTPGKDRPRD
jgi:hypothetical protein